MGVVRTRLIGDMSSALHLMKRSFLSSVTGYPRLISGRQLAVGSKVYFCRGPHRRPLRLHTARPYNINH